MKGSQPHAPDCVHMQPKKPKPNKSWHCGADLPGGRFPVGTKVVKVWGGERWACYIETPIAGGTLDVHVTTTCFASGSLRVEQMATKQYLKWIAEKEAK